MADAVAEGDAQASEALGVAEFEVLFRFFPGDDPHGMLEGDTFSRMLERGLAKEDHVMGARVESTGDGELRITLHMLHSSMANVLVLATLKVRARWERLAGTIELNRLTVEAKRKDI